MPNPPCIVVVGAGISGLAAAYRLRQRFDSARIAILESNDRPGGTIHTVSRNGFRYETGPNGFLDNKPSTLDLCRDLGIESRLVPADSVNARKRYLLLEGKLRKLPSGLVEFLSSGLLSVRGKISLALEPFRKARREDTDESIASFVRRRFGKEASLLADALVTGIFAGDPELLSVAACFPRLVAWEREHGSVLRGMKRAARDRRSRGEHKRRGSRLWSFDGGMQVLIDALREGLGDSLHIGAAAVRLEKQRQWSVIDNHGRAWPADVVVLACPAYRQAAIVRNIDADLAERIAAIPYNRLVVVALGYRREQIGIAVDGFGFIAPQATRHDLLGVQWCSSIYPGRAPEGMVLMRAMCGGWHRPEIADWSDEQLLGRVVAQVAEIHRIEGDPLFAEVVRWPRAIPQYHLGHLERVAAIEERARRHVGLVLAGNAYHGVAVNDCTQDAMRVADRVGDCLRAAGFHIRAD